MKKYIKGKRQKQKGNKWKKTGGKQNGKITGKVKKG